LTCSTDIATRHGCCCSLGDAIRLPKDCQPQDAHRTRSSEQRRESLNVDESHPSRSEYVSGRFRRSHIPPGPPLQGRGRRFEPVNAHGRGPLWLLGFLGQPPSLITVSVAPRPQCVHIRWVPGRVQRVGCIAVEAFVEVAVDVEDGLDAGVSEPRGDHAGWAPSAISSTSACVSTPPITPDTIDMAAPFSRYWAKGWHTPPGRRTETNRTAANSSTGPSPPDRGVPHHAHHRITHPAGYGRGRTTGVRSLDYGARR